MKVGDKVRFIKLPSWLGQLPTDVQKIFELCLNHEFQIDDIEDGCMVLDVSALIDPIRGSFKNDIRVESDCLQLLTVK